VKAVADTNLYVSALVFGGVPKRLLEAAIDGKVDLYISPQIIEETIRICAINSNGHQSSWKRRGRILPLPIWLSLPRSLTW
jgi:predicted nucleic acid-binding protein